MRRRIFLSLLASMITLSGASVAARAGATAPTSQPAPDLPPRVDKILADLEQREVRSLHARLKWELWYAIDPSDRNTKLGELWYRQAKPASKFKIHLKRRVLPGRIDPLDEQHVFDGRWYVELNAQTKTVIRREVRRADDPGDPYKLGEGPFPVPFGQKKADILREFDVALAPPSDDDPPETDHLLLTPKQTSDLHRRYARIEFWVSRGGRLAGLPVQIELVRKTGAGRIDHYVRVTFEDVALNAQAAPDDAFVVKTPAGFEETVEPLAPIEPPRD